MHLFMYLFIACFYLDKISCGPDWPWISDLLPLPSKFWGSWCMPLGVIVSSFWVCVPTPEIVLWVKEEKKPVVYCWGTSFIKCLGASLAPGLWVGEYFASLFQWKRKTFIFMYLCKMPWNGIIWALYVCDDSSWKRSKCHGKQQNKQEGEWLAHC